MTIIIQFPRHRIVRPEAAAAEMQKGQRIKPLAFMLLPVRFWVGCWSWWLELVMEADDALTRSEASSSDRRRPFPEDR